MKSYIAKTTGEHRVYRDICDNLVIERFYKNHLKSQTHTSTIRKREQLIKTNQKDNIF